LSRDHRPVLVNGRRTSITVELPIWDRLRLIAVERGVAISRLIGEIDRRYRLEPPIPGTRQVRSLSSAVRIFVLEHMEAAAGADAIKRR
jgi:predicted DNA-binding ribbon-helix-helix protein